MKNFTFLLIVVMLFTFSNNLFSQKEDIPITKSIHAKSDSNNFKPKHAKYYLELAKFYGDFSFRIENGDTIIATKLWIYRQNGKFIKDSLIKSSPNYRSYNSTNKH